MSDQLQRQTQKRREQSAKKEELGEIIANSVMFGNWGYDSPVNINRPEEVAERTDAYFQVCDTKGRCPAVTTYALALGIDWRKVRQIAEGKVKNVPENTEQKIVEALAIIDAVTETRMREGAIHPNAGIFLMRISGFKDYNLPDEEKVATPNGEKKTAEQIKKEYGEMPV